MTPELPNFKNASIVIVSALMCEAKPLIENWKLKKANDSPFAVFSGDVELEGRFAHVSVVVCGIGALNMAAAIGWLGGKLRRSKVVWLNLGIAGHSHLEVGQAMIVSKSYDAMGARSYVAPQVAKRTAPLSSIISVNVPSGDYPDDGALDMEAYAFYQTATKFSESELIQSFKIISDNPKQPLDDLNADKIYRLIKNQRDSVNEYLGALMALYCELPDSASHIQRPALRATHSQQRQFDDLVERLAYLLSEAQLSDLSDAITNAPDMPSALEILSSAMLEYQPRLTAQTQN